MISPRMLYWPFTSVISTRSYPISVSLDLISSKSISSPRFTVRRSSANLLRGHMPLQAPMAGMINTPGVPDSAAESPSMRLWLSTLLFASYENRLLSSSGRRYTLALASAPSKNEIYSSIRFALSYDAVTMRICLPEAAAASAAA